MISIPTVLVEDVCKSFETDNGRNTIRVLDRISFSVFQSEIVCIVGHSGCGKTTLLRILCGFEKQDSGTVLINGIQKNAPDKNTIMIFQDFNQLLPWKTLLGNIVFALLETKTLKSEAEANKRARKLLEDVGLGEFTNSYPGHVSGGMKQRAAVARALAMRPDVLLMDEPFAALDAITRQEVQIKTKEACQKNGVTVLLVSHSIPEAVTMADRIVVLTSRPGRVLEVIENADKDRIDKIEQSRRVDYILERLAIKQ